jgi:hypothetical protein
MYGLDGGLSVPSDQRLTVAREIRHDEEQAARKAAEAGDGAQPKPPTPAARQRRLVKLARVMPWVPVRRR